MMRVWLTGMLLLSCSATAATYKCTVDGKVVYSDKPCAAGDTLRMKGGVPVRDVGVSSKQDKASASGPVSSGQK